jgi:protein-disulfide isomerase
MTRLFRLSIVALLALLALPLRAQDATPLPTPAPVPVPTLASGAYANVEQRLTPEGFPQLGRADALVSVTVYCSFDAPACGTFHSGVFGLLVPRITAGEVLYTAVPLVDQGAILNGRAAARAALCAAEQGAYWPLSDSFYAWQIEFGVAAYDEARLSAAVDTLGIDRATFATCVASERPDTILNTGLLGAANEPQFEAAPYVLVDGVPVNPDVAGVVAAVDVAVGAVITEAPPDFGTTPEATDDTLVVTIEPLLGERIEPPLTIALPPGWQRGYDTLVMNDVDVLVRTIPLAVYTGPVTGGQGTIVLLWGFPNLVAGNPLAGEAIQPDLWADGLRLLRLAIIEQGCNIGTDMRLNYSIGGLAAAGTQFSAVDCPELADTRGWFAGLRQGGINFVFYMFTEPIGAMTTAETELQAILDSVQFTVPQ